MSIHVSDELGRLAVERCRELRKRQTKSEELLWSMLRNRNVQGQKFRRQHPIFYEDAEGVSFYIADFYCEEKKLIIEVDGEIHNCQKEMDEIKDQRLQSLGYIVLHIANEEIDHSITAIKKVLEQCLKSKRVETPIKTQVISRVVTFSRRRTG